MTKPTQEAALTVRKLIDNLQALDRRHNIADCAIAVQTNDDHYDVVVDIDLRMLWNMLHVVLR